MAGFDLHTLLHRAPAINKPLFLASDLDPGAPTDIVQGYQVTLWLRDLLAPTKLKRLPETSGLKRPPVLLPLNTSTTYEKTKTFADAVAQSLEKEYSKMVVSNLPKGLRSGKMLLDWSQTDPHKTSLSIYSFRAKDQPAVSTPDTSDEVATALKRRNAKLLTFDFTMVLKRVSKLGDLFAPVSKLKQKLPALKAI